MFNQTLKFVIVAAVAITASYNVFQANDLKQNSLSDIALQNVDALSQTESGNGESVWERYYRPDGTGYNCTKTGNTTC